jgi:Uma2 family endonuclease
MATRISQIAATKPTRIKSEPVIHYFDQHPTAEDLMGESVIQFYLIQYLVQVLQWLARDENWFVGSNLNIYRTNQRHEYPIAPDIALFKGVTIRNHASRTLRSWRLYEANRPAPSIVFEISSDSTWEDDLLIKPVKYALLGVREYIAYDPNDPPYWPQQHGRLRGWALVEDRMVEQAKDAQGRIWSNELESWLVADDGHVRLYDRNGNLRLTEGEAERMAKETESQAKERAWAKLRELGIDPETL